MNVLVVEPGYTPYEKEIDGLADMQAIVGGTIQGIYPYQEPVAIVCNDEGMINGLPFNRSVPGGYGGVYGTFFICGLGTDDFCTLPPDQVMRFKKEYHCAEILLGAKGNTPITLRVQPRTHNQRTQQKDRDTPPGRE